MKKFIVLITLFVSTLATAQKKPSVSAKKDSIKTEVVNVVTSYAPKVSDAFKIKRRPTINLNKDIEKKELTYKIISVPVASTFVPKSGTLKGINVGKKERIFDNYIAVGFGNNITPFAEGYMHSSTPFDSEYGAGLTFISSYDPVEDTKLSSSFLNIDFDLFFKQEERYFDWGMGVDIEINKHNWYGLPTNIEFAEATINTIKESQIYKSYKIFGNVNIPDSNIKNADIAVRYFSDSFESSEFAIDINSLFQIPLGRAGYDLEDIYLGFSTNFMGGHFANGYDVRNTKKYGIFYVGLNPYYKFKYNDFDIKIGAKAYYSMDKENSKNSKFFAYPDVSISHPVIHKIANLYVGASGDFNVNSHQSLSEKNPFVSPTLTLLPTNEMYNFFGGIKGVLTDNVNYNVKASYKNEENKSFYVLHKSKSDGINIGSRDGFFYKGYEYGNSFDVVYDDVKTVSVFGEISYDATRNVTIGFSGKYDNYTLKNTQEAWNTPQLKADFFGKYKADKWFVATNIYFVGDRKGLIYNTTDSKTISLKSYIDININGGYHFNPLLSVFVKANNISNTKYQRFTNFNAQGIQVIGGIIWRFDTLF